jgi:hypothetical protein
VPPEVLALAKKHHGFHADEVVKPVGGGMRRDGSFAGPSGSGGGGGLGSSQGMANAGLGFGSGGGDARDAPWLPPPLPSAARGVGGGGGASTARGLATSGPFVRAATSSSNFSSGSLSAPLSAPSAAAVLGPQGFRPDDESAAAAGAAAWARLHASPLSQAAGDSGESAAAWSRATGLQQGVSDVVAAVRAAQSLGRQVDSSDLSAVLATAAAEAEGDDAGDVCLEDDEMDMTRVRRKRVSVYASGSAGSLRSAAVAELSGQLQGHAARSFVSSFTSGGVIGGGIEVPVAVASCTSGGLEGPGLQDPAVAPATGLAGTKRSRWGDPTDSAAGNATATELQTETSGEAGGVPRKASRFGPPVAATAAAAPLGHALSSQARVAAGAAGTIGSGLGRGGFYVPGVRY